jgi:DNA-binding NarL/FixJ family response regulator
MRKTGDPAVSIPGSPSGPADVERAQAGRAPGRARLRVVILSEVRLFREGIAQALQDDPGIAMVFTASAEEPAIALIREHAADAVVIDLATSDRSRTLRAVRAAVPRVAIVALGVADLEQELLACAEHGVANYVTREGTLQDLVGAIEDAVRSELHCSPQFASAMFRRLCALASEQGAVREVPRLTRRESEVLAALEEGLSNKAIARRLGIEQATVKNHVHSVLEKLRVERRAEIAARAHASRGGGASR